MKAEDEAIKRNIYYSTTDTFDFQAVNFYISNGYESIGIIRNYIEGHDKYYFRKCINIIAYTSMIYTSPGINF